MSLQTDLNNEQLCDVVLLALTLAAFEPACTAAGAGGNLTFDIEYPLQGNLTATNALHLT